MTASKSPLSTMAHLMRPSTCSARSPAVDSRVTVVRLRRNFGQTSALAAGFDHARGEYIIAMDGDLQHDPSDIPLFLEKLSEGYDIVSGWRKQRIDNLWLRRIPSRCANWLMAKLSGVDIHDFGTTFKAYRRDILEQVPLYGELHRFIPALPHGMVPRFAKFPSATSIANVEYRTTASPAPSAYFLISSPFASC